MHFDNDDCFFGYFFSGSQIYYICSANMDGTDDDCEKLGWKKLHEYNPAQRRWKYLSTLAAGNAMQEDGLPFEDELEDEEDYYPSLPFAALFSCFKVFFLFSFSFVLFFKSLSLLYIYIYFYLFLFYFLLCANVYSCLFCILYNIFFVTHWMFYADIILFYFIFLLQPSFYTLAYWFSFLILVFSPYSIPICRAIPRKFFDA